MGTIDEVGQLNHEAWKALARGAQEGWDVAVGNVIRLVEPEDTPERDAKIAFVSEFAGKIAAHPDELIVFHNSNEEFTQFHALVPHTKEPFELCAASDRNEKPFLYLQSRSKGIGRLDYPQMAGSRDIAFSNIDPKPPIPVWTGPGSRPETISPDLFFEKQMATRHAAVGNAEIADLFTSLKTETDIMYNSRLFGALFHVALLADEFEVSLPYVESLKEEAATALLAVESERALGETIISMANINRGHIKKIVESYNAQTVVVRDLYGQARAAEKESSIPTLYRRRTNPLLDVEDISVKMSNVQDRIESLVRDELGRREAINRQHSIISAIAG